jgi:predicted RNA-binding Zn ribbon-like protein
MTAAVSSSTEKKLRNAMERLLAGQPARTDGRLTKANLHVEAGVSRATMNRAAAVIADWNAAVGAGSAPRDAQVVELRETVTKLKQTIAKLRQHNTDLENKNRSAVTVIAELHAQLRASRGDEPTGTVTQLPVRQQRRRW